MKRLTNALVLCLLLGFVGSARSELVLLENGGILDTLYGLDNVVEIHEDQLWINSGQGSAAAQAKWAGYVQHFGYLPGASAQDFEYLFAVSANGYLAGSPSAEMPVADTGEVFRFADFPGSLTVWSSRDDDNADDSDHMKTFLITGGDSAGNYAICWEDLPDLGDRDYQDLVVEVSGVTPVPEPATVALLGLSSIVLIRRRHA